MNATVLHSCALCSATYRTEEVRNIDGHRFAHLFPAKIAVEPRLAEVGGDVPSGRCKKCGGPLYPVDFHPT